MPFEQLKIWQKGMALAKLLHKCTMNFPKDEVYGLKSQMRKAAVSIPSNIAEGSQRSSDKDFRNFILIAKGSLAELRTQVLLAGEFQYLTLQQREELLLNIEELNKMIFAFSRKLIAVR
ncbi:MAG: four helix bundle protein [Candidatus Peregrinibacteria bacterium]|nr:four helix bundle protein [Candidatus Peregrinibacteria bacterium]